MDTQLVKTTAHRTSLPIGELQAALMAVVSTHPLSGKDETPEKCPAQPCCYLIAAETSAAAPLAKPSTESLSSLTVVEVSSGSLMPLGLELWGVQAAVSCCTCQ